MVVEEPSGPSRRRGSVPAEDAVADVVSFRDAVKAWSVISLQTFGGPAGQIAVTQRSLDTKPELQTKTG